MYIKENSGCKTQFQKTSIIRGAWGGGWQPTIITWNDCLVRQKNNQMKVIHQDADRIKYVKCCRVDKMKKPDCQKNQKPHKKANV